MQELSPEERQTGDAPGAAQKPVAGKEPLHHGFQGRSCSASIPGVHSPTPRCSSDAISSTSIWLHRVVLVWIIPLALRLKPDRRAL